MEVRVLPFHAEHHLPWHEQDHREYSLHITQVGELFFERSVTSKVVSFPHLQSVELRRLIDGFGEFSWLTLFWANERHSFDRIIPSVLFFFTFLFDKERVEMNSI